jgi:hypothetical protein
MRLEPQKETRSPAVVIPPVTDTDICRTANLIVTRYGDDALRFAAQQMEHFRQRGENKEQAIWARIGMAVDDLLFAKAEIRRSME